MLHQLPSPRHHRPSLLSYSPPPPPGQQQQQQQQSSTADLPSSSEQGYSTSHKQRSSIWVLLWAMLLLLNTYVYSYSSMKSLENVRIVFWVLAPLVGGCWYLAFVLNRKRHAIVGLVLLLVLGFRFFYGRPGLALCTGSSGNAGIKLRAVVFSEVLSKRGTFVEEWFARYMKTEEMPLTTDYDNPPLGLYLNELEYKSGCENAMQNQQRLISYVYRVKRFLLEKKDSDADWWLLLENDAEPVYPKSFQRQLECLAKSYPEVDFVFLDFRNIAADFSSLIVYAGMNGVLIRRESFEQIAQQLNYNAETCAAMPWPMSPDSLLGMACKQGKLKCISHPLLTEHGFPSSLGYGRDVLVGEQKSTLWEWLGINLIITTFVLWLYWKKHFQWKVYPYFTIQHEHL
ncbi:hypothetical protein BASA81_000331 [Batrachochytrium salamandrivorans]|nr:hypothetical protein BASA81_000331 [Batrachochytrium salamandrivorans]